MVTIDILILVSTALGFLSYMIGIILQAFPEHDRGIHFIVLSTIFNIAALIFTVMDSAWWITAWIVLSIDCNFRTIHKYERENADKLSQMDSRYR